MDDFREPVDLDGASVAPLSVSPRSDTDTPKRGVSLAPRDKTPQLLAWIDAAKSVNWTVERNLLVLMLLLGTAALLAKVCGLLDAMQ